MPSFASKPTSKLLGCPGAIQGGAVVFYIVMLNTPANQYVIYALNRMLDTATVTLIGGEIMMFPSSAITGKITATDSLVTHSYNGSAFTPVTGSGGTYTSTDRYVKVVALSSIAVDTQPTKNTYTVGEAFDNTGMVVKATYSDATTATLPRRLAAVSSSQIARLHQSKAIPILATPEGGQSKD